jgi:hypothetical protein
MTLRYSEKIRNAGLDGRIAAIGPNPTLHIFGATKAPLVVMTLPKEWMAKAAKGIARKTGDWVGVARASGKPMRFEICHRDGETEIGGDIPGDMTLDVPNLEKGQNVTIGTFSIAAGNGQPAP